MSTRILSKSEANPALVQATSAWDGSGPLPAVAEGGVRVRLGGEYEPLLELASGGMGKVLIGRRMGAGGFERLVVIKQIHRHLLGREEMHRLFKDEAHIASLIHHVNVVPVIDVVEADGELLLVMEYVESVSMSLLQKRPRAAGTPVPPAVLVRVLIDALAGLHAAHQVVDGRGRAMEVVHRDVSPQNIIIGRDGVSRVIDFGVAKAAHRFTETESGQVKGKFGYMSPEQVSGKNVDRRTDVFASGVVLFEAFSGTRLFAADNAMDTMRRVLSEPLPDPATIPRLPVPLRPVVMKALARDPSERFATAAELAAALSQGYTPATHAEVAAWLELHCGGLLEKRRELLTEARSSTTTVSRGTDTIRDATGTREEGTTQAQVSVERGAEVVDGDRRRARWVWAAGLVVAAVLAVAFVSTRLAARRTTAGASPLAAVPDGAGSAGLGSPAGAGSASGGSASGGNALAPAVDSDAGVVLELTASAAIQSVQAPGMRGLELDGRTARLVVEPWEGELLVEARLDGKRDARARVSFTGPHSAVLTTTATSAGKPAAAPATRPRKGAAPPADDLHESPYTKGTNR